MAETKTSEVLSTETSQQKDLGLYSQGKLKLNFNDQSGQWEQNYEPVKSYKMFIPPPVKTSKATSTELTTPTVPTVTPTVTQPAVPLVQPKDKDESYVEKLRREKEERFGPGQDPMTFSKTMSNIFTPGTEQNYYYTSKGILKQDGDNLTVNFDMIDEKGGYGLPSVLGAAFRYAEKDIMEGTMNKLRFAGILEGSEIQDTKGTYTFKVNQDKMNKYVQNASSIANSLTGGYYDSNQGKYVRGNDYLQGELGKMGKDEAVSFIADLAILSDNDNYKNIIRDAITFGNKGAAAALLAYQSGTKLDLDATGLFGFAKYNEAFKQSYTDTYNKLKAAEEESDISIASTTTLAPSITKQEQRQQTTEMKTKFNELVEQAKKETNPQNKITLLNKASAFSGAGDIAEPKADGTQYPSSYGGVYQGTTPTKTSTSTKTDTTKTSSSGGSNKSSSSSDSGTRSSLVNKSTSQKLSAAKKKYGSLATKGK